MSKEVNTVPPCSHNRGLACRICYRPHYELGLDSYTRWTKCPQCLCMTVYPGAACIRCFPNHPS